MEELLMKRLLTLAVLAFLSLALAQSGTLQYNSNASDPLPKEVDEKLVALFMETSAPFRSGK